MSLVLGPTPTPTRTRRVVFVRPDWSDGAVWTANRAAVAGAPITNLVTDQPSMVAGFDVAAGSLILTGVRATPTRSDAVCIPYVNATPAATWNVGKGDSVEEADGVGAFDRSSHANHGTLVGGPRFVAGKYGSALSFDGTVSQYLRIPPRPFLQPDWTWMAWVRVAYFPGEAMILMFQPGEDEETVHVGRFIGIGLAGEILFDDYRGGDFDAGKLFAGKWHHVCVTYDFATGLVTIVLDGDEVGSKAVTAYGDLAPDTFGDMTVGGFEGSASLAGEIDDVRFYNRALTLGEIQAEMQSETSDPVRDIDLVGHYRLNGFQRGTGTFGAPPNRVTYARRAGWCFLPYPMDSMVTRVTINDPSLVGPLYIGRLVDGPCWQSPKNWDYGFSLGFKDLTKVGFTPTGQRTATDFVPVPKVDFTIRHLERAELLTHAYELQREFGTSLPFLVCCDPGDDEFLQAMILYGCMADLPSMPMKFKDGWESSWSMEAMI